MVQLTYPGVYVEELPSGVNTIVGVATSITAFIGAATRGPTNNPIRIQSFADFNRKFGGLSGQHPMSYAVQHFFLNGGSDALIVRVVHLQDATTAHGNVNNLPLKASGEGIWGDQLKCRITNGAEAGQFNLTVRDKGTGATETFRNLSIDSDSPKFVTTVLQQESQLVRVKGPLNGHPSSHQDLTGDNARKDPFDLAAPAFFTELAGGNEPTAINSTDVLGNESGKTGMHALELADLFNLLCIPPLSKDTDDRSAVWGPAAQYCGRRRAILLVDPTADDDTVEDGETFRNTTFQAVAADSKNAAAYFPWIRMPDPLKENRLNYFAPSGAVAGTIARTDSQRGVWKSPAGTQAGLVGVSDLKVRLTDPENGRLNPIAVNCLRYFTAYGNVVWGARTLAGADSLTSEWKYLSVRRTALFIEESLYRGTQWVIFEPNDEPLWAQIRLNVGAFMRDMFRQGAFQGASPQEAYFVKCDGDTTTQSDVNKGIVNILVGFAPLKPAEFVVIRIQQIMGDIET